MIKASWMTSPKLLSAPDVSGRFRVKLPDIDYMLSVFTNIQRHTLFERVVEGVSAKGGKLNCMPPDTSLLSSALSPTTSHSDELTPEDSASTLSSSSRHLNTMHGHDQRSLGFGRPAKLSRMSNHFARQQEGDYSNMHSTQRGLQSLPHMLASPTMGLPGLPSLAGMNMGLAGLGAGAMGMQYAGGAGALHQPSYNMLAHEFGVEPDVVAALAQRLAFSGHPSNQGMAMSPVMGYAFAAGRM